MALISVALVDRMSLARISPTGFAPDLERQTRQANVMAGSSLPGA